jgi:hypothetical protein
MERVNRELGLLRELHESLASLLGSQDQPTPEKTASPTPTESVPLHLAAEAVRRARQASSANSVDCAVFAPEKVSPGECVLLQVFAFLTGAEAEAQALAKEFDATAVRRGLTTLEVALEAGQVLTFHLQVRGAEVSEPVRKMTWRQKTAAVQFVVSIPEDRMPGPLIGTLIVSAEGVPVGRIDFRLTVTDGTESSRFRRAFTSYASRDRAEVVRRVQMLRRPLTDVEVFQDVLNLEPGEEFAPVLFQRIDECDLFLLFWSNNARESTWVRRELEHALRRQGPDGRPPPTILPEVIEGPPPPELEHLHFNDYLLYLIR